MIGRDALASRVNARAKVIHRLRSSLANGMLALLYAVVYIRCYVSFLNYYFEYAGFALYARDLLFLAVSTVVAVAPILCYRGWKALSSVVAVFVYILLYVPIILTFALGSDRSEKVILLIQLTFFAGMCLLFIADGLPLKNPVDWHLRWNLMRAVLPLTILLTLYVLVVYRGSLRFVSFGEAIYEQRSANADLGVDIVTRYASSWLGTVCIPLCLAYGLVSQRYRYFLAGTVACVTLYMATASKVMILFPFAYVGFYAAFASRRPSALYPVVVSMLSGTLIVLLSVTSLGSITFLVSSILMYRTVGNGGQLAVAYYEFFDFYPQTDYSHVMGLRALTHPYPYGAEGLGQVIGSFYWNDAVNANASFWVTDGLAAMGLPGVAFISVFCAGLFVCMNAITRGENRIFVALCFLPFMMTLLNASLFSSLWSGGAVFLLLFFLLKRRDEVAEGTHDAPNLGVAWR